MGEIWNDKIEDNISNCDFFVVLITHPALRSKQVEKEIQLAKRHNKIIIPCFNKSVGKNEIKWNLDAHHGIEFEDKYELARYLYSKIPIKAPQHIILETKDKLRKKDNIISKETDLSIRYIIEELLYAENEGKSEIAEQHLSKDFISITRSNGIEENREKLLELIQNATEQVKKDRIRILDKEHFKVFYYGKIAISRSIFILKQRGQEDSFFRNIHIFENRDGKWLCKIWQVTKLHHIYYTLVD